MTTEAEILDAARDGNEAVFVERAASFPGGLRAAQELIRSSCSTARFTHNGVTRSLPIPMARASRASGRVPASRGSTGRATPVITMTAGAYGMLNDVLDWTADGRETGGALLGRRTDDGFLIVDVSGPGDADRSAQHIRLEHARLLELEHANERAGFDDGAVLCGDWHSHPVGPEASQRDLDSWRSEQRSSATGQWVGVIFALDPVDYVVTEARAWVADANGVKPARLIIRSEGRDIEWL